MNVLAILKDFTCRCKSVFENTTTEMKKVSQLADFNNTHSRIDSGQNQFHPAVALWRTHGQDLYLQFQGFCRLDESQHGNCPRKYRRGWWHRHSDRFVVYLQSRQTDVWHRAFLVRSCPTGKTGSGDNGHRSHKPQQAHLRDARCDTVSELQDSRGWEEHVDARLVCFPCKVKGLGVALPDRYYGGRCLFLQIWVCKWGGRDGLPVCRKTEVQLIPEVSVHTRSFRTAKTRSEEEVWWESGFLQPWYVCLHFIHIWGFERNQNRMPYRRCPFTGIETRHPYCRLSGRERGVPRVFLDRYRDGSRTDHRLLPHTIPDWVQYTRCQAVHRSSVPPDPRQGAARLRVQSILYDPQCLQRCDKEKLSRSVIGSVQETHVWVISCFDNYFDLRKIPASQNNSENKPEVGSISGLAVMGHPQNLPNHCIIYTFLYTPIKFFLIIVLTKILLLIL